jgi:predicted DsbA family dithiol-disulfide isomerase
VGLRNLLTASSDSKVAINYKWEPFFLNPNHPPEEGENIMTYLKKKYGPGIEARIPHLEAAGRQVGIEFTRNRKTLSTLKSHMLMEYAYKNFPAEVGNNLMEVLFKRYFENGENVSSDDILVQCAAECGMNNPEEVSQVLNSSSLEGEVRRKAETIQSQYRVNGVPYFIIENQNGGRNIVFSGAQPPDVIAEQLENAQA